MGIKVFLAKALGGNKQEEADRIVSYGLIFSSAVGTVFVFLVLLPAMWILNSIMGMNGVWYAFIAAEVLTCVYCRYVYKKNPIRFEAKGEENGTGQQDGNQPHDAAHL